MLLQSYLVAASAVIILSLGVAHLWLTFAGTALHPRGTSLRAAMEHEHPHLTRQTTMWRAWVGFNASHSLGAILFGLMYGYFAVVAPETLFQSPYLLAVGLILLLAYVALGKRYWFSVPFRGIVLATVLYIAAIGAAFA
ncbi:hypothetical protein O4H66_27750 [Comamonadaceae bacterium G21597-S1]|nr:hypothetical protein [Comamonadaceae bacterium G21597-S1]